LAVVIGRPPCAPSLSALSFAVLARADTPRGS